jgi:aarF domain-containing kinase
MGPLPPAGRLLCLRWILAPRRPLSHAPRLGLRRLYSTTGSAAPPFPSRARRRLLLAAASGGAAAVMVPGALVASGAGILAATTTAADDDDDDAGADAEDDDGRTDEQRMLAASRAELAAQKIPTLLAHSARWRRGLWLFVDLYIWEPAATALRFLRLLALFVPVALATPAVWCGARDPLRGGERRGALWWYGALVWAMERAGASFIKVRF